MLNQAFLLLSFRFAVPFARVSVPVAFPFPFPFPFTIPFMAEPLTKTVGLAAIKAFSLAKASSLCSSANSSSSLSLRSSSATFWNTNRCAIRRIAHNQNRFRLCRLARRMVEMTCDSSHLNCSVSQFSSYGPTVLNSLNSDQRIRRFR